MRREAFVSLPMGTISVQLTSAFPRQRSDEFGTPSGRNRGPGVALWAGATLLIAVLAAPYVAQQIAFAIARGQELARADVARKELAGLPYEANRCSMVAKIVEPSVVGIQTLFHVSSAFEDAGLFAPDVRAMSQGSGVIVDSSGYILTNAHVIHQAEGGGVTVQLADGRTIRHTTIVGADPATDLAVLKVDAGKLPAASWGDSDAVEVGEPVLAVGSPYGLTETVTAGIISAKNRKVPIEDSNYEDFLQTDAAVNPGNSGGPLVNMKAQIVGINTAIIGRTNQGIGFTIPSNAAKKVYELLRSAGIQRGWVGVALEDLDVLLAERLGLRYARGALVTGIINDSPAERGGLMAGDAIVGWNKQRIANANDLRIAIAKTAPGSEVPVVLYRDEKRQRLSITVAERPNQPVR
jgi:serine protease Do